MKIINFLFKLGGGGVIVLNDYNKTIEDVYLIV